jgi:hypothetical protein
MQQQHRHIPVSTTIVEGAWVRSEGAFSLLQLYTAREAARGMLWIIATDNNNNSNFINSTTATTTKDLRQRQQP